MHSPSRPPVLATKEMTGIFWSLRILVTTGSLMYTFTTARFCLAYRKISSSNFVTEGSPRLMPHRRVGSQLHFQQYI